MRSWLKPMADAVAAGRLELVCSPDLLAELATVMRRPRIAREVSANDAIQLRKLYAGAALFIEVGPSPGVRRDPRDDYLLALAEASKADYLVTRDEDLLVLERHGGTEIIYPARFLQLLHADDAASANEPFN